MKRRILAICLSCVAVGVLIAVLALGCGPTGSTIEVNATLDGDAWGGPLEYELSGPGGPITGSSVPNSHSADAGDWTCAYVSGGPPDADLIDIAPSPTQNLPADGSISFTFIFETEQVDASITFVSWTIDGQQVDPGSYTVYPPTVIDCEYDVVINGTYCESVNVTVPLRLDKHFQGPGEYQSWHVANAPGCVYTIPPGTIWSQNASHNGAPVEVCTWFDVFKCEPMYYDMTVTYEAHKGTNHQLKVNWLRYNASEADAAIFDTDFLHAGCWGTSQLVTSACVSVPGDVNPANDCSGDSPILYITYNYTCP